MLETCSRKESSTSPVFFLISSTVLAAGKNDSFQTISAASCSSFQPGREPASTDSDSLEGTSRCSPRPEPTLIYPTFCPSKGKGETLAANTEGILCSWKRGPPDTRRAKACPVFQNTFR
uniref:Uncharacterized protein n=1 Tax=Anser cygnoides TaxID=8845 RepID=A0A8B9E8W9_ANSCY